FASAVVVRQYLPASPPRRSSDLQQPAPHLDQVVALVEDQQDRSGGAQLVHQGPAVVVQAREQRGVLAVVVDLRVGVEDGERLVRSEEHTSELQSRENLVCRLLLE